ncbi:MAG: ABC transporter substrate-binding protein [candidate division Zixibacteria bacterium]|nr:ABC transporter substrate-binding protein [candidate division Zixibacteria bacterium]
MKTHIRLGHSPDPDDAFMFYALAKQKIDPGEFTFEHVLEDIESLNHRAERGELEVTAISIHAYPKVAHLYALLGSGGSMGDNYGPMVVARENFRIEELSDAKNNMKIAVPGTMTSAFLALTLAIGEFKYEVTPFDKIISEVSEGKVDVGLIIHEGQLTYAKSGLKKILDLGEWWNKHTNGLPLPLGGNCVRRDLGKEKISRLSAKLRESIQFSLDNRAEAAEYALEFGRDLSLELADKFIGMYVNDYTIDYGSKGREAIKRFLTDGETAGLITDKYELDFA